MRSFSYEVLSLLILYCRLHTVDKQGVRVQHCALIFGMELCADVPLQRWYLNNLYKIALRVTSHTFHAVLFKFGLIVVVKLVAVAVALLYVLLIIYVKHTRALFQYTLVGAQTHGATHIGDVFLLLHDVNHVVRSYLVHLSAVSVGIAQHVAGKLNHNHLHAEADAEGRNVVCAGVVCRNNFSFNATLSEAWADQYAVLSSQFLSHIVFGELFRVDERDVHLIIVVGASVRQAFAYRLVGILKVIFTYQTDVHRLGSLVAAVEEGAPGAQ